MIVSKAATVEVVTSLPTSAYTPAVIKRSCASAIRTGTANLNSNLKPM